MELAGHSTITALAIAMIALSGLASLLGTPGAQLVFYSSFTLFSILWNPDVDLKVPYVGHRGITHSLMGTFVVAAAIGVLGFLGYTYLQLTIVAAIILPLMIGASLAWMLHVATDMLYDRAKQVTWVIVIIGLMYVYTLLG